MVREKEREKERVVFLGKLSWEELFPIIKRALFCVMPSRIDNLPNTCIEAMALGKIVIGTSGASFEQMIEDGRSGFLIERENRRMLIETIGYVYCLTEEQREKISREARKRIEEMNPERIKKQILAFYLSVIESFRGIKKMDFHTERVVKKYNNAMIRIKDKNAEQYILRW